MRIKTKHTPFQGFASKPSTAHNLNVSSKETVVRTVSLPTVSNKVSGMTLPARYLTVDTGSVLERRKSLLQNSRGQQKDRGMGSRQMDWQEATDRKPQTYATIRIPGSLDDFKVVQDGHDVLWHEHIAGVYGHTSHRDQQGVWRRDVKEEFLKTFKFYCREPQTNSNWCAFNNQ